MNDVEKSEVIYDYGYGRGDGIIKKTEDSEKSCTTGDTTRNTHAVNNKHKSNESTIEHVRDILTALENYEFSDRLREITE